MFLPFYLDEIISVLDEDTTSLRYTSSRGIPDVPFALGEDSALMLGQLPSGTKVEARVPVIIFDEEDNVVLTIEPFTDSSTAQEFADLLGGNDIGLK